MTFEEEDQDLGYPVGVAWLLTFGAVIAAVLTTAFRHDPRDWATTDAIVLSADSRFATTDSQSGHMPEIRYRYEVNLTEFESDTFSRPEKHFFRKEAIGPVMQSYGVGQTIKIHYKRSDPATSMIEVNTPASMRTLDTIRVIAVASAIIAWIFAIRLRMPRKSRMGPGRTPSRA